MIAKRIIDDDLNITIQQILKNVDMSKINVARECKHVGISRTSFYKYWSLKDNGNYGDMRLDELNKFLKIFGYRLDMLLSKIEK